MDADAPILADLPLQADGQDVVVGVGDVGVDRGGRRGGNLNGRVGHADHGDGQPGDDRADGRVQAGDHVRMGGRVVAAPIQPQHGLAVLGQGVVEGQAGRELLEVDDRIGEAGDGGRPVALGLIGDEAPDVIVAEAVDEG